MSGPPFPTKEDLFWQSCVDLYAFNPSPLAFDRMHCLDIQGICTDKPKGSLYIYMDMHQNVLRGGIFEIWNSVKGEGAQFAYPK